MFASLVMGRYIDRAADRYVPSRLVRFFRRVQVAWSLFQILDRLPAIEVTGDARAHDLTARPVRVDIHQPGGLHVHFKGPTTVTAESTVSVLSNEDILLNTAGIMVVNPHNPDYLRYHTAGRAMLDSRKDPVLNLHEEVSRIRRNEDRQSAQQAMDTGRRLRMMHLKYPKAPMWKRGGYLGPSCGCGGH